MKIHRFTILAALLTGSAFAQTNTFPTSGSVGIGTTSPLSLLHVVSTNANADQWLAMFSPGADSNGYRKELVLGYHGAEDYAYIQGHHQNVRWSNLVLQRYGGYVGIGTATPSAALDVHNGLHIHGSAVYAATGAGLEILKINDSLGTVSMINAPDRTERELRFYGTPLTFFQGGAERMRIASNGSVGIGVSSPLAKLHIKSHYSGEVGLMIDASDTSDPETYNLRLQPYVLGAGMVGYKFQTKSANGGTNVPLTFSHNGNVGIGTTNPTHKLAVNGTIKAKEVIVETTGWSDYVFSDDYALQPLTQVEAHIKEHKHLPGIPSASTVATNGVNVGDMQAALLAKVEELTLHLIAQEKELLRLRENEKKIAALEAKLQQLQQSR